MYSHEIESRIAAIAGHNKEARRICETMYGLFEEQFLELVENRQFTADQLIEAFKGCNHNTMLLYEWLWDLTCEVQ